MELDEGDAVVCERMLGTGSAAITMLANEAMAEELKREEGRGNCPGPRSRSYSPIASRCAAIVIQKIIGRIARMRTAIPVSSCCDMIFSLEQ